MYFKNNTMTPAELHDFGSGHERMQVDLGFKYCIRSSCKEIMRRDALDELWVAAARYQITLACDAYQMC